jgi:hypothetical protein
VWESSPAAYNDVTKAPMSTSSAGTVLLVTDGVPYPPARRIAIRNLNTNRCLARHHPVIVLSLAWDPDDALGTLAWPTDLRTEPT